MIKKLDEFLNLYGSIIVLLGKGLDEYQIIGTTKHYFSERQIVEQL
jgi:UDP-N-acetylmuramyl tripeptide synthase